MNKIQTNEYSKEKWRHTVSDALEAGKLTAVSIWKTVESGPWKMNAYDAAQLVKHLLQQQEEEDINASIKPSIKLHTAMMAMHGRVGNLIHLKRVFANVAAPCDVHAWTAYLAALIANDQSTEALHSFEEMKKSNVLPNAVTYTTILAAVAQVRDIALGTQIHTEIAQMNLPMTVELENSLMNMYGKCGQYESAVQLFERQKVRTIVSWNVMISVCVHNEYYGKALEYFRRLKQSNSFKPNAITYASVLSACIALEDTDLGKEIHNEIKANNILMAMPLRHSLMNLYSKCKDLDTVKALFDDIKENQSNCISWTTMINAFVQNSEPGKALEYYSRMKELGIAPTDVTYVSVLGACASLGNLALGKDIKYEMELRNLVFTETIWGSLINMYAKCGSLAEAETTFTKLQLNSQANLVLFNIMMNAYATYGEVEQALKLFQQLQKQGLVPDKQSLGIILNACSHAGLADKAIEIFSSMEQDFGLKPESTHITCLVDTLSRAQRLDEAESFAVLDSTNLLNWTSILGACRTFGDVDRAERIARKCLDINAKDVSVYILLANLYAMKGRWQDHSRIRDEIARNKLKKIPGYLLS